MADFLTVSGMVRVPGVDEGADYSSLGLSCSGTVFELTKFTKIGGGIMTKVISLNADGTLNSDGSHCRLSTGIAERVVVSGTIGLAAVIEGLGSHQAISLGRLSRSLHGSVPVVTKSNLAPGRISRTDHYINYGKGEPAFVLIDVDTKGMPPDMRARIDEAGGFWPVLCHVLPELEKCARVVRPSTSSWIGRNDVEPAQWVTQESGIHFYVAIADGMDTQRFLSTLSDRCWLAGFGWMRVGRTGQYLARSLIDASVGNGPHLIFEGSPVLSECLAQGISKRKPAAYDGGMLDTVTACPPLSVVETARLKELQAKDRERVKPESLAGRESFKRMMAVSIALKAGHDAVTAADLRAAERACEGTLLSPFVLRFDDPELAGTTVGDVLADPARYEGETLADPSEGVSYGTCKAKIMRRDDGSPWIHSFAHGRTVYELRHNFESAAKHMSALGLDEVTGFYADLTDITDLSDGERLEIRKLAAAQANVKVADLDKVAKNSNRQRREEKKKQDDARRAASRTDKRPMVPLPGQMAPVIPQMEILNEVLGGSTAPEPPMRDLDEYLVAVRLRRVPNMHALTSDSADCGNDTRLPPPSLPLLSRLSETEVLELIESHVDFVVELADGPESVCPNFTAVKHFTRRSDGALPVAAAISTLPILMPDGTLLKGPGLDRDRSIIFRVPKELLALIPDPAECTPLIVAKAMRYLTDEVFVDVKTDYEGKCTLVNMMLTILERVVLPERPSFFVTAGRRGGGKTTTLFMVMLALFGVKPSAAAWSTNEEERRKALLSYLMEGVPTITWDNIVRGTQISCPHIEKACTTEFYSDRKLGQSKIEIAASSAIHLFTGNNIGPKGDLASRSLQVRLAVETADPENRPFKHSDPTGWVMENRGRILTALYVILMGNPALRQGANSDAETRFKTWWRLVGSAVENAAEQHKVHAAEIGSNPSYPPASINFKGLFLKQEDGDEEGASLGEFLAAAHALWPKDSTTGEPTEFAARDMVLQISSAGMSNTTTREHDDLVETLRDFLMPEPAHGRQVAVTSKSIGRRLTKHIDAPVMANVKIGTETGEDGKPKAVFANKTVCLRTDKDAITNSQVYWVIVT